MGMKILHWYPSLLHGRAVAHAVLGGLQRASHRVHRWW
jgi:hypothetical protein